MKCFEKQSNTTLECLHPHWTHFSLHTVNSPLEPCNLGHISGVTHKDIKFEFFCQETTASGEMMSTGLWNGLKECWWTCWDSEALKTTQVQLMDQKSIHEKIRFVQEYANMKSALSSKITQVLKQPQFKILTLVNRPYRCIVPPHQSSACVCTRLCCGSILVGGLSVCLWNWGNLQEHKLNNKKLWINHEVTNLGLKAEGGNMERVKKSFLVIGLCEVTFRGEDKSEGCNSIHPINPTQKDTKPRSVFMSLLNLTGCCSLYGNFLDLKPNVKVQSEFQIRDGRHFALSKNM